jgi:mannopine transport system substrate-binding protein
MFSSKTGGTAGLWKLWAGTALLTAMLIAGRAAAQEEVVVVTTGGAYERALKETWFEPFTKATGIKVTTATATDAEQRARGQAMVQSGDVTWDTIINVDVIAESPQNRSFTEDLTQFCGQTSQTDLLDKVCNPAGVRISFNSTLLAFDPTKFDKKPKTWADFWDVAAFPGPRALPNLSDPWRVFAAALMADGVPADHLFPLDIDRALKKLDQIKPQVQLWWKTGDQIQQGFRNGDYVMGMIWGTRANALKAEGRPIEVSYDGAFLLADTMQVLRGAPHREAALALLKYFLDNPAAQARFAERFNTTPPSMAAVAMMSEEARSKIPTSPEVFSRIVKHDAQWINANQAKMLDIWNAWIAE